MSDNLKLFEVKFLFAFNVKGFKIETINMWAEDYAHAEKLTNERPECVKIISIELVKKNGEKYNTVDDCRNWEY